MEWEQNGCSGLVSKRGGAAERARRWCRFEKRRWWNRLRNSRLVQAAEEEKYAKPKERGGRRLSLKKRWV
jgi:hypothetical protein